MPVLPFHACLFVRVRVQPPRRPRGPLPGTEAPLGSQLAEGPLLLDLGGSPLGFAGTRQVRVAGFVNQVWM